MNIHHFMPLICVLITGSAWACGGIELENARIIEAPPGASVLAGYGTLRNPGNTDIKLTGADSQDFALIEFHFITPGEPTLRMKLEKELTIPAHGSVVFSPGKLHMMLFRPSKDFHQGDNIMVNLYCSHDRLRVTLPVKAR